MNDVDYCQDGWTHCDVFASDCFPNNKICVFERSANMLMYCPNTEHIMFCADHECPSMFKCYRSYCIPIYMICDGINDCPLSEDESECAEKSCPGY